MVVQHNMPAINANRYFGMNNNKLSKSLEKLSSGYAINRAGDNAAGLAVSEKMRAQISGLTQASKNAQDGISMTQTFEGALTETDSILQRMRSLAVQSSNGSYDDSVDRAAIQLEYDQLNDELNQIADTDFNGVVVLNGGEMADGLKAIEGKFDYANKKTQVIDQAKAALGKAITAATTAADADITAKQATYDTANAAIATTLYDLSENGTATEWNTIDDSGYTDAEADALFTDIGLAASDATEISVTFTCARDAAGVLTWTASSATSNATDKTTYSDAALTTAFANATDIDAVAAAASEGDGGFTIAANGGTFGATLNVINDTSDAKTGDTITLKLSRNLNKTAAPDNIGFVAGSKSNNVTSGTGTIADITSVALDAGLDDAAMTQEIKDVLDVLQGADITFTYGGAATTPSSFTIGGTSANAGAGAVITMADTAGNNVSFWAEADASGVVTISTNNGGAAGTALMTITGGAADVAATTGTATAKLAFESYSFSSSGGAAVTAGDNAALGTSNKAKADLAAADTALTAAKAAKTSQLAALNAIDVNTFEGAKAYLAETGVSVSDSNDASTAKLSYTDNITLQVGARTKDSVNFTFKYESDGIGSLADDLNCTAKGLGTDKISLATQKDANAAIDKIDNAINKVSMVRGTFGALQNRLEHKIDNLNTTNENLTAAESRIRDTDMATEMMNFTKNQILSQASQAMLAQANTLPQGVLSLLQ